MRALLAAVAVAAMIWLPASAEEPKQDEAQAELEKLQGLWQTSTGGMEHKDGKQVVRTPSPDGPCFFICGDRLIWLDAEGKPAGREQRITLDVKANPKQITLTPIGEDKRSKLTHGIYSATGSALTIHVGLESGRAPKQFLELNKPVKDVDGREWLVGRKKLQGK